MFINVYHIYEVNEWYTNCFPARITIRSEILLTMLEKYFYHKRKLLRFISIKGNLFNLYNTCHNLDRSFEYSESNRFNDLWISYSFHFYTNKWNNTENTKSIFFTINKIMQILLIKNTHFDFSVKYNFMEE